MGKVIKFPNKSKTIDEILIGLAEKIASDNAATNEDTSFIESEAKEIRKRYFPRNKIEVSITFDDTPQRVEEIRKIIADALDSLMNDFEKDKVRMAAEIMTLKLMLRGYAI